ncbi:uncharacterized protein HMPREF1541_04103 [Cyphellophora europaea CBS 101466]|uniref:SAC domain-containing protein n=1 Tax=Cyphellophora europaea (strain CBS 101466) TaxID=1220924 RepID=W2S0E7_CYPE1|nr:uncharacterized protein HMPREF1541_04103 [Cyphellophora europaea CBS 101466]ETN42162.1 hypothetical protein HMPREF1541_04103 [Cyphellophora europaea CBS 101466]
MESFTSFSEQRENATEAPPAVPVNTSVPPSPTYAESEGPVSTTISAPAVPATSSVEEGGNADLVSDNDPASPGFPQLSNTALEPPSSTAGDSKMDDEDEEIDLSKSFHRTASPSPAALHRNKDALVGKPGDEGVIKMHKFTLYETLNNYYIVGTDLLDLHYRILKIDRTCEPGELNITEDGVVYTRTEVAQILNAIDEGNKATGGLKAKASFWGLLGFIRFTSYYYMIYVTKRSQVALVGGHYIYTIEKTEMLPLTTSALAKFKSERHIDESRYVNILNNLDLTKSFYFSYSYDCTRTLQHNIMREREALQEGLPEPAKRDHNDMFVWNHHLLGPAKESLKNPFDWCLSIIHGYVDQAALSVFWGRVVYVTLIARRSRHFAGARYLKRGANDLGYVANDVETEQIVSEMKTTSFHSPGPDLFANPNWTSFVQHRGSIPLHWLQDSSGVSPKPDIQLSVVDPYYVSTGRHFNDMFRRYGTPIYVVNLIKQKERVPRETKLLKEYKDAVDYLNINLPKEHKILYRAWDMSRAQKSRGEDVIGMLESIADDILPTTGFFQNGNSLEAGLRLQNGVARTNCIDCLDRTNAAQFMIAKKALGHQLVALGVIESPEIDFDSDVINLFTHMWHDHGDTVAVQYGGSHLVNTMATYRKINQWHSQSRDMVETFKRYYNNSFMDSQRQEAYNLFLGNYVLQDGQPMLWELTTDYYLHHSDPRSMFSRTRPSYRQWYTPEYLNGPSIPPTIWPQEFRDRPLHFFDDFWVEYYRPLAISTFKKLLSFKMHSNMRYIPFPEAKEGKYDYSPFTVRKDTDRHGSAKSNSRNKGVRIIAPSDESSTIADTNSLTSIDARLATPLEPPSKPPKPSTLGPWLDAQQQLYGPNRKYTGIIKETSFEVAPPTPRVPKLPSTTNPSSGAATEAQTPRELTKAELAISAFTSLIVASLEPAVSKSEEYEYHRYITHPSTIPLITDTAVDYDKAPAEFLEYVSRNPALFGAVRDWEVTEQDLPDGVGDAGAGFGNVWGGGAGADGARANLSDLTMEERAEVNAEVYRDFGESSIRDEPLTVTAEDLGKKRYKAYRQWLKGKSLFKQRLVVGGEVV